LGYLIFVWGIRKITRKAVLILIAVMLPNIVLAVKHPGFWVKNSAIASRPEVVWENFARQYLTYISPKTIFQTNPDIDQQHQIPGLGLAFWWMVIPFGLGWLRIDRKWRWLFLISVIPAAFSGVFISVQRALPMLFPLSIIIGTGLVKAKRPVLAGLVVYSLVLLWRGYFVLLPTINARAWDYGYQQIAKIIEDNPDTEFVFDNTRNPRSYMLVWFYAGRQENVQFRPIDWKADSCRNTVLIGDTLAISETQAGEHKLKFWGEIKDPVGEAVFKYYKTNPAEKCGEI
jgi:hypothetical protein